MDGNLSARIDMFLDEITGLVYDSRLMRGEVGKQRVRSVVGSIEALCEWRKENPGALPGSEYENVSKEAFAFELLKQLDEGVKLREAEAKAPVGSY